MYIQLLMKYHNEDVNESNTIGALLITSKQHSYAMKPYQLGSTL